MSDQGEPDNEQSRVSRLLDMHQEQVDLTNNAEYQVMKALWELRGSYSIEDMAQWTGWSRQTIYNKWARHGWKVRDDAQPKGNKSKTRTRARATQQATLA